MDFKKIVEELNSDLYKKAGDNPEEVYYYQLYGYVDIIGFGQIILWNSENEEREWNDLKNDYEPMVPYIKRTLNKYGKKLQKYSK